MKKRVITTALAGLFVAPTIALADVTINGYVSEALQFGDSTAAGVKTDTDDVATGGGERFWFGASEDLGNGMTASASFTYTTSVSHSGTELVTRSGNVAIAGDFGTIQLGSGEIMYEIGQITDGYGADFSGSLDGTSVAGGLWNFTRIDDNFLRMDMAPMGPLKISMAYGLAGGQAAIAGKNYDSGMLQLNGVYDMGNGMLVDVAYASYTEIDPTTGFAFTNANAGGGANASPTGVADATGLRMTLKYTTEGGIFLAGTINDLEVQQDTAMDNVNNNYDALAVERKTYNFDIIYPVATGRVGLNYNSQSNAKADGSTISDSGRSAYTLYYQHDMGAATYLYAMYNKSDQDGNYSAAAAASTNSTEGTAIRFGIKFSF